MTVSAFAGSVKSLTVCGSATQAFSGMFLLWYLSRFYPHDSSRVRKFGKTHEVSWYHFMGPCATHYNLFLSMSVMFQGPVFVLLVNFRNCWSLRTEGFGVLILKWKARGCVWSRLRLYKSHALCSRRAGWKWCEYRTRAWNSQKKKKVLGCENSYAGTIT